MMIAHTAGDEIDEKRGGEPDGEVYSESGS